MISIAKPDDIGYAFSLERVALYFSAPWCEPCKTFYPAFKRMVTEVDNLDIVKVDVEKNVALGQLLNVRTIPTMVFLQKGVKVGMRLGVQNEDEFVTYMKDIFGDV